MYGQEVLADLREQLAYAAEFDLYTAAFDSAGIDPGSIDSWEAFQEVPFVETEDLEADFEANPPEGSLYTEGAMISFSPMGDDLAPDRKSVV